MHDENGSNDTLHNEDRNVVVAFLFFWVFDSNTHF